MYQGTPNKSKQHSEAPQAGHTPRGVWTCPGWHKPLAASPVVYITIRTCLSNIPAATMTAHSFPHPPGCCHASTTPLQPSFSPKSLRPLPSLLSHRGSFKTQLRGYLLQDTFELGSSSPPGWAIGPSGCGSTYHSLLMSSVLEVWPTSSLRERMLCGPFL